MSARGIIAADLGGTNIRTGLVIDRQVRWSDRRPTPAGDGAAAVLDALAESLDRSAQRARSEGMEVVAVGIGSAGVVDSARGTITSATDIIPGWTGTPIGSTIAAVSGLPVVVINDVHAHALGEALVGAGRGHRHVLMVTAGTGIGGAQVVDGAIIAGAHGVAGHVGHVPVAQAAGVRCPCGRLGHVEGIAAGIVLASRMVALGGREGLAPPEIVRFAEEEGADDDHRLARAVLDAAADGLGDAIGGVVNVLDPSCVILGGGMAIPGTRWWDRTTAAVARQLLLPPDRHPVVPPTLGEHAALVGAAIAAESMESRTGGVW